MDAKILRIFILPLFFCDISIEHVHRQFQENAFTLQSSACVLLPGNSLLACRTALDFSQPLVFIALSSRTLSPKSASRTVEILLLGLRVCACMCDYRHTFPIIITLIEINPRTIQWLVNKNN